MKGIHFGFPFFMRLIFILYLILNTGLFLKAEGDFVLSEKIIDAYKSTIRFDLNTTHNLLTEERKIHPGNGFSYLIDNYADFIKVFVEDDPIEYRKALAKREQRIKNLELCDNQSPYKRYCLAEIYLQWSFLRFQQDEKTKSANDLRKAASFLNENQKRFPSFILNKKGLSIIHILSGSIPDNLKWLAQLAGISGNVDQGRIELNSVISWTRDKSEFNFLLPELLFYSQLLSVQLLDDQSCLLISQTKDSLFSKEPLIQYIDILVSQKKQNSKSVIELIKKFPQSTTGVQLCFLSYLSEEARLNLGLADELGFQKFITCSQGKHFKHAAIRKIAWQYLLQGNTRAYHSKMEMLLSLDKPKTEEDKQAFREAHSKTIPNIHLLRARLDFDGGNSTIAIQSLLKLDLKNRDILFLTEYAYRLGRCYHWLNNEKEALKWYEMTIRSGAQIPEYYAASASYQMGKIYINQNKLKEAKAALIQVSKFPEHAYKSSLDTKAKTALKKIQ